jgi:NADH-quinone oxidoreductase subunit L
LNSVWFIFLSPAIGAALSLLLSPVKSRRLIEAIAVLSSLISVVISAELFLIRAPLLRDPAFIQAFDGPIAPVLMIDRLSALMSFVVALVSFLIVVYSIGYMGEDPSYIRYYSLIQLFIAGMLGLVLSGSFLYLYLFWEVVGLCSCLLIAHWYERPEASRAGVKAFIVTRFGDVMLLTAISLIYLQIGDLRYDVVSSHLGALPSSFISTVMLLSLGGAFGKSAQVPLHVWLPDAMEGPTSVSALIHAATMVKAGVYLVARLITLSLEYGSASIAALSGFSQVLLWIGSITAFLAATMALVTYDIKRVLAYSTISQLGYMFAGLGAFSSVPFSETIFSSMLHLTSHAFFKALLFMGAGAVIHATGTRDMREMGGLRRSMPITSTTFLIGAMALSGIPPMNGFFSKDAVMEVVMGASPVSYILLLITAILTPFYIFRAVLMTFFGEQKGHAHEASISMTLPMILLAASCFITPSITSFMLEHNPLAGFSVDMKTALISVSAVSLSFVLFYLSYWRGFRPELALVRRVLEKGYYFDDLYTRVLMPVFRTIMSGISWGVDRALDALSYRIADQATRFGNFLREIHTGMISHYVAAFSLGLILLLAMALGVMLT